MVKKILFWGSVALLLCMAAFLRFVAVGYSFSGLVCFFLAGVLLAFWGLRLIKTRFPKTGKWAFRIFVICLAVGFTVIAVTEGMIIAASFGDPEEPCEYIVVLGCLVRNSGPSASLWDRIYAARDYLDRHPDVIAILSGGKGSDEPMTEAQCMYDQLVKLGVSPERLWLEDKATSTWENIQFSLDLIERRTGTRPTKLGILSSEYHLFRATMFAHDLGIEAVGIPARTSKTSQAINHFMREVAGVWHYIILGGQYD